MPHRQRRDRAVQRVASWLMTVGTRLCLWSHHLDVWSVRNAPRCEDCEQPEQFCYCDEKRERDHAYDAAYTAGFWEAEELYRR